MPMQRNTMSSTDDEPEPEGSGPIPGFGWETVASRHTTRPRSSAGGGRGVPAAARGGARPSGRSGAPGSGGARVSARLRTSRDSSSGAHSSASATTPSSTSTAAAVPASAPASSAAARPAATAAAAPAPPAAARPIAAAASAPAVASAPAPAPAERGVALAGGWAHGGAGAVGGGGGGRGGGGGGGGGLGPPRPGPGPGLGPGRAPQPLSLSIHGVERATTRGISLAEVHAAVAAPLVRMRGEDGGPRGDPSWLSLSISGPRLLVIIHTQPRPVAAGYSRGRGAGAGVGAGVGAGGMQVLLITCYSTHVTYGAELALEAITERGAEEDRGPYLVGRLAEMTANAAAASELVEKLAAMHSDHAAAAPDARAWAAAADALVACLGNGKVLRKAGEGLKARRGTPEAGALLAWFRAFASNTRRWLASTDPVLHLPHAAGEEPKPAKRSRDCHRDASIPGLCSLATGDFRMLTASGARLHEGHTPHTQLAAAGALLMLLKGADASPLGAGPGDGDMGRVQGALHRTGAGFTPEGAEAQLALPAPAERGSEQRAERCADLRAASVRAVIAAATSSGLVRSQPRLLLRLLSVVEPVHISYGGAGAAAAGESAAASEAATAAAGGPGRGGARDVPEAPERAPAPAVTRVHLSAADIRDALSALLDRVVADGARADLPGITEAFSHALVRAGEGCSIAGGMIHRWKEAVKGFPGHDVLHRILDTFPRA